MNQAFREAAAQIRQKPVNLTHNQEVRILFVWFIALMGWGRGRTSTELMLFSRWLEIDIYFIFYHPHPLIKRQLRLSDHTLCIMFIQYFYILNMNIIIINQRF